jgi:PAS domain S-box-containing protein
LRRLATPILYVLMALFMPTIWTSWFIDPSHIVRYPYALVPRAGPLNLAGFAIFAVIYSFMLAMCLRRLKDPTLSPADRQVYLLTFAATACAGLCLIDWLEWFGPPIPPLGFVGAILWISITAYGIFRYRLFQLTAVAAAPAIVEALPGALFVVNTGGEIVIVNPGAKTMTGETESALLGRNIRDLLPITGKTLECAPLNLESGDCAFDGLETILKTAGGKEVPISLSARVIRRPDGLPDGATFIAIETTRLREQMTLVEKQKEELTRAVEEMRQTQKLLIGRENQMVEFKKKLDELKSGQTQK